MITWEEWLRRWGLYDPEIAQALEMLGLRPEYYKNPLQLATDLRKILELPKKKVVTLSAQPVRLDWDVLKDFWDWIADKLNTLLEKIKEALKPYVADLLLIGMGSLIAYIAPGWYKAIGGVLIAYGAYDFYKKVGGG